MKRLLSALLAVCIIASCAVFLTACGEKEDDNFPVTVGGTEITEEPERVVVLNDAFADIILYMGYDTKLVGRSVECNQSMLNVLPSVGAASQPAMDTLMSLKPDLVISDGTLSDKARRMLSEEDVNVVDLTPPITEGEIKQSYIDLGTALGGKTDGAKKGEESYEKLFDLLDEYSTTTDYIVVTDAYLYLDEQGNYCTFTQGSLQEKIFSYNGAFNVFQNKTTPEFRSTETTDENGNVTEADEMYIRRANPTYLFLDGTASKDGTVNSAVYDKLVNDPNFANLTAIKENRVTFIPRKNFYRPGVTFEETLFTMIDELNKDEEAAEDATANATEAPTEAPTKAAKKPAATEAPATEADEEPAETGDDGAVSDDAAVSDDGYSYDNEYADDGVSLDDNGNAY